jgi:hypothetical protein
MKPGQPPVGMHLTSAVLCIETECSIVFDGAAARTCPRCGSSACYPISIWLDRIGRATAAAIARTEPPEDPRRAQAAPWPVTSRHLQTCPE